MPQQTRVMQNVLGTSTTLDEAFLDSMREVVDPPADLLAVELCEGGEYKIFADLIRKHRVWEDDGSPVRHAARGSPQPTSRCRAPSAMDQQGHDQGCGGVLPALRHLVGDPAVLRQPA